LRRGEVSSDTARWSHTTKWSHHDLTTEDWCRKIQRVEWVGLWRGVGGTPQIHTPVPLPQEEKNIDAHAQDGANVVGWVKLWYGLQKNGRCTLGARRQVSWLFKQTSEYTKGRNYQWRLRTEGRGISYAHNKHNIHTLPKWETPANYKTPLEPAPAPQHTLRGGG